MEEKRVNGSLHWLDVFQSYQFTLKEILIIEPVVLLKGVQGQAACNECERETGKAELGDEKIKQLSIVTMESAEVVKGDSCRPGSHSPRWGVLEADPYLCLLGDDMLSHFLSLPITFGAVDLFNILFQHAATDDVKVLHAAFGLHIHVFLVEHPEKLHYGCQGHSVLLLKA